MTTVTPDLHTHSFKGKVMRAGDRNCYVILICKCGYVEKKYV